MKGGTQMNRYRDAIKLLRETDVGVKGPFEEAAQTIILLRWENRKFEERLSWFEGIETPTDIASKKTAGAARHWAKIRGLLK